MNHELHFVILSLSLHVKTIKILFQHDSRLSWTSLQWDCKNRSDSEVLIPCLVGSRDEATGHSSHSNPGQLMHWHRHRITRGEVNRFNAACAGVFLVNVLGTPPHLRLQQSWQTKKLHQSSMTTFFGWKLMRPHVLVCSDCSQKLQWVCRYNSNLMLQSCKHIVVLKEK